MGFKSVMGKIGKVVAFPVVAPIKIIQIGVKKTMKDAIFGIVRHVLTTLGGGLVASGALSGDDLNAAIGAVLTLGGVIWSVINKRKAA